MKKTSAATIIIILAAVLLLITACKSDCETYIETACQSKNESLCIEARQKAAAWKNDSKKCKQATTGIKAVLSFEETATGEEGSGPPPLDPELEMHDTSSDLLDKLPK